MVTQQNKPGLKWFAIYTRSRFEKKVYGMLTEKNLEVYLPLQKKLKIWSDRKKWVEEPLFPSYLFIRTKENKFSEALTTPGVVRIIKFQGKPVSVPDNQIENIRLVLSGQMDYSVSNKLYEKGEVVLINYGPLKGLQGKIIQHRSQTHLVVEIPALEKSLIIIVPSSSLIRS